MVNFKSPRFKTALSLQALGWGIYFIISSFFHSFFVHGIHDEILYIKQTFAFTSLGFLFSFILYFLYEDIKSRTKNIFIILTAVLLVSYFTTLLWMSSYKLSLEYIFNYTSTKILWRDIYHYSYDKTFVLLIWSGIYFIITYWAELKKEKEKSLRTDIALNEAKYNMLKYQVNPHFLFNTLNSIIGMIDEDKSKAKNMVEGLSEFFRYSLNKGDQSFITLNEEIEGIKNYLAIEKNRYEENLTVEYNIESSAGRQNIPGFIIHPLVENAIKYGMKSGKMPLTVSISAQIADNSLIIKVINSGRLVINYNGNERRGIGISNIIERLKLTYGNEAEFSINENNNLVEALITIHGIAE